MRNNLVVVTRSPDQEPSAGNLGESARRALDFVAGIIDFRVLQETPSEATHRFETERAGWPLGLDLAPNDRGATSVYTRRCDWRP
jgi:hypothetical protein